MTDTIEAPSAVMSDDELLSIINSAIAEPPANSWATS